MKQNKIIDKNNCAFLLFLYINIFFTQDIALFVYD